MSPAYNLSADAGTRPSAMSALRRHNCAVFADVFSRSATKTAQHPDGRDAHCPPLTPRNLRTTNSSGHAPRRRPQGGPRLTTTAPETLLLRPAVVARAPVDRGRQDRLEQGVTPLSLHRRSRRRAWYFLSSSSLRSRVMSLRFFRAAFISHTCRHILFLIRARNR